MKPPFSGDLRAARAVAALGGALRLRRPRRKRQRAQRGAGGARGGLGGDAGQLQAASWERWNVRIFFVEYNELAFMVMNH